MTSTTSAGAAPASKSSGNSKLSAARSAKNDEFYTRLEDIERELVHYRDHFRDKIVFLNCDDPEWSNFWRYFELNFDFLGLKKLVATHYHPINSTYKLEIVREADGSRDVVRTELEGNGDFRSSESIAILEEADIVVTNPPFSLFREYVTQLMEFEKDFIIIGNMNAITYKETWRFIQEGRLWMGVTRTGTGQMWFRIPDGSPDKTGQKVENGVRYQTVGSSAWFTTLDHARRHEEIVLFREYDPTVYPNYDNYDAIEVSKVADIPVDYTVERWATDAEIAELRASGFVITELSELVDAGTIAVSDAEAIA